MILDGLPSLADLDGVGIVREVRGLVNDLRPLWYAILAAVVVIFGLRAWSRRGKR